MREGYKLQLERDKELLVLHIKDTATGKRTEVRGKPGYETNYDPSDSLHILLDKVGKSANISELMNGEVVSINPKHPDADRAKAATDRAYNEAFDTDVEWIKGAAPQGASVFAAKVDDAYIEITYKPMNKGVYISFTRGARMSVTGEGGQNKIFGAVINHIKKWVDANKPQEIYFSAFKPRTGAFGSQDSTRSGLYRKMVQRFASQNGYDYDVEDTGNEDTFILKRKGTDTQTNEALDQPYPVRWTTKDDDEWEGKAKTEAGDSIQIMITQGYNNHKWEVDFYVGGSMQVTGKGDQFRVFATVVSAVKKWWSWLSKSKQPVEAIIFSAFKGNKSAKGSAGRSSLYNRFANQFARSIGFTVSTIDRAEDIKFVLTNPNYKDQQAENFADSKINEALDNPYPINWVKLGQHGDSKANVKLPDGSLLEIEFYLFDTGMFDIIFKRGRSLTATGSGDEFRIFATVKSAIVQWWKQLDKEGINQVTFSAAKADTDKDSKRRYILYKRFAKQFAQQSGWGLDTEEDNKQVNFILKNPNPVNHDDMDENFADGKKPGRKGLAKRSGVNTKASVSSLRKTAKNSSGEKQRMAHWLANMKAGKAKKK